MAAFPGHSQGAENGSLVAEEEEKSGVCQEPQYRVWKWTKSLPAPPSQPSGKRKTNKLASSGNSNEHPNRHLAPGLRPALLPGVSSVTDELAAAGIQQLRSPEGGVTFAAV